MQIRGSGAIITGASSGIGAATARRLAEQGARVALVARRASNLDALAVEIREAGGDALPLACDVRDQEGFRSVVAEVLARWGRIDLLINNAGLGHPARVVDLNTNDLREQVEVNLIALMECSQAVLPAMLEQRSGHIINVASIAGLVGLPTASVYCATKFAVVGFSDSLRREVRRSGIAVTALCPGFVASEFSPELRQAEALHRAGRSRLGVMRTDYVARVIAGIVRRPRAQVIIPPGWGVLVRLASTFPWVTDRIISAYLARKPR